MNKSAPTTVGTTPRDSRWYAARPTSLASHQPRKLTGRYRSTTTSPVRIRVATSSVTPPPNSETVAIIACASQQKVTASVTSYPPAWGLSVHTAM